MNKQEISIFIEEMEEIGDKWIPEEVENVYGRQTLHEALADRKAQLDIFFDIVGKFINKN